MHSLLPKLGKPIYHHTAYFFTSETWPMNNKVTEIKNLGRKLGALCFLTSNSATGRTKKHRIQRIPVTTKMILLTMLGLCAYGVLLVEP